MSDGTKIEWTEATWNPITGCSVTSPGCTNCYAMKLAGTRLRDHPSRAGLTIDSKAGPIWTGETRFNEQWLDQPLRWKRPRMIFVCAHGDLFHESVPDEWIDRAFAVMALAPQHTFQVLTKRSARMREYLSEAGTTERVFFATGERAHVSQVFLRRVRDSRLGKFMERWPLPNVWLGVSVEDQQRADERIPDLLATPAAVRWLSCEPLLGAVELGPWMPWSEKFPNHPSDGRMVIGETAVPDGIVIEQVTLDWIVAGGESGTGARPMHPDWARSLRDQCAATGVPFFFKQWGEWAPHPSGEPVTLRQYHRSIGYIDVDTGQRKRNPNRHTDETMRRIGKKRAGRLLDGVTHDGYPA